MERHTWETMSEEHLDALLTEGLSQLPPEDIVAAVTPWKRAMHRVLIGLALSAITVRLWCLDTILPAIGIVYQLLGFRALRRDNRWFQGCYVLSVVRTACLIPSLILRATILPDILFSTETTAVLTAGNLLLVWLQLLALWRALIAVQRKAGRPPRARSAAALLLWYGGLCLLALLQYRGLLIGAAMLLGYVWILRSLHRLSRTLDETGYVISPAPVRLSERGLVLSLAVVLLAGLVGGYVFGSRYPMNWRERDLGEHISVEEEKAHLAALGFPEYVLNDLSAEDIAACEGAVRVVVDVTDEPVNDGRSVTTIYGDGQNRHIIQDTVYDEKELRITGVGVQLPGERERWILFHHFLWTTDPGFYGTEAIQLWPTYRDISEGWRIDGDWTGRVLYDDEGRTFSADYYSLGTQTYTQESIFWDAQQTTDVFAAFSLPRRSENQRGYVAYPVAQVRDGYIISSWFNYTHQISWRQYPAVTAVEKRMTNNWREAGVFRTVQDALQFYPTEQGIKMIS